MGLIIERTLEYRNGYCGAPAWPKAMLYVGDESDGCPYALNCDSGELLKTDHGNLERIALERYERFEDFVNELEFIHKDIKSGANNHRPWWRFW